MHSGLAESVVGGDMANWGWMVALAAIGAATQAQTAAAGCTYTTTNGTNYWSCVPTYPASLSLTNSADVLTLSTGQNISGDVLARNGDDSVTIDGANISGKVDGGSGDDKLTLISGIISGKLKGGDGNDIITVQGGTVESNVEGDDGWDKIYIQGGLVKGTVIGDEVYVSGGTIQGDISGGGAGQNNIITITGGTVLGTIYGYEGNDKITLNGGTVNGVSGGDGNDQIVIKPLTYLTVNGTIRGNDGDDKITFDRAVDGENFTFATRSVDGGDGHDQLYVINGSQLTLTTVQNFGELHIENSSLTLDGTSYIIGTKTNYGVVEVDATSRLALTAQTVSLSTLNFDLGTSLAPGGVLALGTGTDASVQVTGTFSNYGTITLADGRSDSSLTISGNYFGGATAGGGNGTAGNLALDVITKGQSGTADSVTFTDGTVSGTTTLYVTATGKGGFTGHKAGDGILVIDASGDTVSDDAFQLAVNARTGKRDVVVGAFSYRLAESNGDYYLQSSVLPQVPAYVAGPSIAANYAFQGFNTLSRRLGEVRQGDVGRGSDASGTDGGWQVWARAYGGSVDVSPSTGWGFNQQTAISQFGLDRRFDTSLPFQIHGGIFGGYGSSDATVGGSLTTKTSLSGWSTGAYVTLFSDAKPGLGAYVDIVGKADFLDTSFSSTLATASTSSQSYGASVEAGYGFSLAGGAVLVPQAELSYLTTRQGSFVDTFGLAVNSASVDNLVGRLGVQLQTTIQLADGSAHTPYLTANVLHDFQGDSTVTVAQTAFLEGAAGTWYTLGAGITSNINANFALYAQANYALGDVQGWAGNLGLRARF
jgi:outer membrane autotransporter protein